MKTFYKEYRTPSNPLNTKKVDNKDVSNRTNDYCTIYLFFLLGMNFHLMIKHVL